MTVSFYINVLNNIKINQKNLKNNFALIIQYFDYIGLKINLGHDFHFSAML